MATWKCNPAGGGDVFFVERPDSWSEYDVLADFDGTVDTCYKVGPAAAQLAKMGGKMRTAKRKRSVSRGARKLLRKLGRKRYTKGGTVRTSARRRKMKRKPRRSLFASIFGIRVTRKGPRFVKLRKKVRRKRSMRRR